MAFPVDHLKLQRIQKRMQEQQISALVVRAPDNVLYLTNYWPMKGYAMAVFPAQGKPTLIVIEPQKDEAAQTAWTDDIRLFRFYDESDPRPPTARALDLTLQVLRERSLTDTIAIELSQGSQICDRMVGEPTVFTQDYFQAFGGISGSVVDAVPLLVEARMIKTEQEIERMTLANELAAIGMEYARERIKPGETTESEVAALIEGHIHAVGVGYRDQVEMARAFTLVWSGPGIATFTSTGRNFIAENEPTLVELWVCADGYWTDLTKNLCPGRLTSRYSDLLDLLLECMNSASQHCRDGAPLGEVDRMIRSQIAAGGYPGQPSHPVAHGVGARAHEPPYAHQAVKTTIRKGMVLAIEPGVYWKGGGGLRVEDNFLVTNGDSKAMCPYPDDFRMKD